MSVSSGYLLNVNVSALRYAMEVGVCLQTVTSTPGDVKRGPVLAYVDVRLAVLRQEK